MSGVCSGCRIVQQVILSLLLFDSSNTNQDSLTFFKHREDAQLPGGCFFHYYYYSIAPPACSSPLDCLHEKKEKKMKKTYTLFF